MAKSKKELVKKETAEVAKTQESPKGLENFTSDLIIIPRIKLLQALSVEVSDGIATPGKLVNTLDKTVYGQTVKFIPVKMMQSRIFFKDIKEGKGILCRADDGRNGIGEPGGLCRECELSKWSEKMQKDGSLESIPPVCTQYINFIGYIADEKSKDEFKVPMAISFGRTSFTVGKQLANILMMRRQNIWNFIFEISGKLTHSGEFKFYVYEFKMDGISSDVQRKYGETMYDYLSSLDAKIDMQEDEVFDTVHEANKDRDNSKPDDGIPF